MTPMKRMTSTDMQQGMALIESLIAILIFSLGILGIIGLQAVNLRQSADAKHRVDASFLANQTVGMIWADRANIANHAVVDEAIAALPNGKRTVTVTGSEVTVTITWQQPGEPAPHRHVVIAHING
jgi:type IV pilus assembly protein PilV